MSFTNPAFNSPWGHVAFVEEVFSDSSINISEANLDNKGGFNVRKLTIKEWKDSYGGKFIDFT